MARVKISLGGYMDPVRRPRWIIWTLVVVILVATVMIPVLGVTSTIWFCANGCHKVQDDTIEAYHRSSHSEISCMTCHMPVGANPVIFLMHKAEALGELAQTLTNNYSLPLNKDDEVALTMPAEQCTQCHNEAKRHVNPDPGLKIDHQAHAEAGVNCTICHNRIAHNEDFDLKLHDPKTGNQNQKHANFMEMTACFRCHTQEPIAGAPPGQCFICHTNDFQLLPKSHQAKGFFPAGHGKLAAAEEKAHPWMNTVPLSAGLVAKPAEASNERFVPNETKGEDLRPVDKINLCSTCHSREFCTYCHGVPMPHPADFQKKHGTFGQANPQVCSKCHGGTGVAFCSNCHHGTHLNYTQVPNQTWKQQHPLAVNQVGASGCLQGPGGGCHSPTYCALCHANGGTLPSGAPPF